MVKKYSVPIKEVAKVYGKDCTWVRKGIIEGWLPIGIATRDGKRITCISDVKPGRRINYYVSPTKLKEHTGYEWGGYIDGNNN